MLWTREITTRIEPTKLGVALTLEWCGTEDTVTLWLAFAKDIQGDEVWRDSRIRSSHAFGGRTTLMEVTGELVRWFDALAAQELLAAVRAQVRRCNIAPSRNKETRLARELAQLKNKLTSKEIE